ncbi:agrin-like [Bolinopsis microptera]|uniref:agrin-like n=1 Tax=Bolinopsis microptera TaxID=2820187 RepID=UPI003079EE85
MFTGHMNSLLVTLSLLVTTKSQPVIDNINQNYFAHRWCSRACAYSDTCFYKNNVVTCLPSCPRSCPTKKSPVCGSDGETYLNKCLLKMRNCHLSKEITVASRGECPSNIPMYPEMICDMDCSYFGAQHVCASDGNTYRHSHFCEVTKAACKRSGDFKIKFVHYGPCQENACSHVRCPWGQVCKVTIQRGPSCVCNSDCPAKQREVCADDGKTYYNQCHLDAENCMTRGYIRKVSDGFCNAYDDRRRRIHRASVAFSPE